MELFAEALRNGEYWIFATLLTTSIVLNLYKFIGVADSRRKRRLTELTEAIDDKNISTKLKEHLKDEIDIEHFRLIHGILVSKIILDAILIIKERIQGKVSFRHLVRLARIVPNVENIGSISYRVKLSWFDKIFGGYNLLFGVLFTVLAVFLFLFTLVTFSSGFNVGLFTISILLFFIGLYMFVDGAVLISVYYINKALEEYSTQES